MAYLEDIRFFRERGADHLDIRRDCEHCAAKESLAPTERLLWALREKPFQLDPDGKYHHLYLNFTTRLQEGQSQWIAELPVYSGESNWYRYIDIGVSEEENRALQYGAGSGEWYLRQAVGALTAHFCREEADKAALAGLQEEILQKGEDFEVPYKTKESATLRACLWVGIADDLRICPRLRVTNQAGEAVLDRKMPRLPSFDFADQYGTILLSKKRVTIRPRRNVFAQRMQEIYIDIEK